MMRIARQKIFKLNSNGRKWYYYTIVIVVFSLIALRCENAYYEKAGDNKIIELPEVNVKPALRDSIISSIKEYNEKSYYMEDIYVTGKPTIFYVIIKRTTSDLVTIEPSDHVFKDFVWNLREQKELKQIGYLNNNGCLIIFVGDDYPEFIRVNKKTRKIETTHDNNAKYIHEILKRDSYIDEEGGSPHEKVLKIEKGQIRTLFGFEVE